MDDEMLISLVRKYSVLYDVTHSRYMDNAYKVTIWNEIGKQLNSDPLICKVRWNNIRDNYRKSLKKPSISPRLSNRKVKLYKYGAQLQFLNKHFIVERNSRRTYAVQEHIEIKPEYVDVDVIEEDEVDSGNDEGAKALSIISDTSVDLQNQQSSPPPQSITIKCRNISDIQKNYTEPSDNSGKLTEYLSWKKDDSTVVILDPVDAFLSGIAPTLKNLNPYYLNLAKSEIFAIVQKYDMKMLMGDR